MKASYQMLEIWLFGDWGGGGAFPPSTEISVRTFVVKKKYKEAFCLGYLFLQDRWENLKLNVVLIVILVLESKAL